MSRLPERVESLEAALRVAALDVVRIGAGRWSFALSNGLATSGRARMVDSWLDLTVAIPETIPAPEADAEWWLRFNAWSRRPVSAARSPLTRKTELRTDVGLDACDIAERVASACQELREALHDLAYGEQSDRLAAVREPVTQEGIEGLLSEAGWSDLSRVAGDLAIGLATSSGLFPARFDAALGEFKVDLADLADYTSAGRRSLAILLLTLPSVVRSTKGVVAEREASTVASLVSPVGFHPSAAALDRSLSALSVACRLAGREVRALRDERLAASFLARWDQDPTGTGLTRKEEHTCLQLQ
jgi:hypothetical protein